MGKKTARANHSFMLGSFILIILLFLTVFLFLMWAFKAFQKQEEEQTRNDRYEILIDSSSLGVPMKIYVSDGIDDSLIFSGTPSAEMTLSVGRFAEESTLLAVDEESDQVTVIPLPKESARITLHRSGSEFTAE